MVCRMKDSNYVLGYAAIQNPHLRSQASSPAITQLYAVEEW